MQATVNNAEQYKDFSAYVDDMVITPAFAANPVSLLLEIAKSGPVAKGKHGKFEGIAVPDIFTPPDSAEEVFLALSFDACKEVAQRSDLFLSGPAYKDTLSKTAPGAIVTLDDPEHKRNKKLVMPSFSHHSANEGLQPILKKIIGDCLDTIIDQGKAELMREFTSRFPWQVIATLFGLPLDKRDECEAAAVGSQKQLTDPEQAKLATAAFVDIYQKIIDDHRTNPADDLTTLLLNTEVDGQKLSDDEVRSFLVNIVSAGLDTTTRQTAILITQLLENPDQFALLKQQPELLDQAIWESLRTCPTTGTYPRIVGEDTLLMGTPIPKGSRIFVAIHAANHDASRWDNPLKFDITRPKQQIMSFNMGAHSCLGQNLAQAEIKIAMQYVLERLLNLRKDENRWQNLRWGGYYFRSPSQLPVKWDRPA